jgi:hypothetical protein
MAEWSQLYAIDGRQQDGRQSRRGRPLVNQIAQAGVGQRAQQRLTSDDDQRDVGNVDTLGGPQI